jgi:hypothetical protein
MTAQPLPEPAAATLRLGIADEQAAIAFWASIAEHPPRSYINHDIKKGAGTS